MKLYLFILALAAIGASTPILAGQGDAPSNVPAAQVANAPGITDTEIKIGQTMPYSGPISGYATVGKAELAYFKMVNDNGGINGRKINLISRDDGYSPPKTVEQIRKLVEEDNVASIFQSLGDVTNAAVQRYLNDRGIPQLFIADGSARWDDPQHFPWTMGWSPSFRTEGRIDAAFILRSKPDAKIGVLVQDSLDRVLRSGGRTAVCVHSSPDRAPMWSVLADTLSSFLPEQRSHLYLSWSLGDSARLENMFADAGFREIRVERETRTGIVGSFDEYWGAIEAGPGQQPQSYLALPEADRRAVREQVKARLADFEIEGKLSMSAGMLIGSGRA
jgi:hypothetical protein